MEGRCCNNMFKDCVGFLEEDCERRYGTAAGGFGCAMRSAEYIGDGRGGGEKRKGCLEGKVCYFMWNDYYQQEILLYCKPLSCLIFF